MRKEIRTTRHQFHSLLDLRITQSVHFSPRIKNRSTHSAVHHVLAVSGKLMALAKHPVGSRICSEPPSLKSGGNTAQQSYFFKNLMQIRRIVKKLKCFQTKLQIAILSLLIKILVFANDENGVVLFCWGDTG